VQSECRESMKDKIAHMPTLGKRFLINVARNQAQSISCPKPMCSLSLVLTELFSGIK